MNLDISLLCEAFDKRLALLDEHYNTLRKTNPDNLRLRREIIWDLREILRYCQDTATNTAQPSVLPATMIKHPMLTVSIEIQPVATDPEYIRTKVDIRTPHRTAAYEQVALTSVFQSHFDYAFEVLRVAVKKEMCPPPPKPKQETEST